MIPSQQSHPVAYLRRSSSSTANGNGRISFDVQRKAVLDLAARRGDVEPELIVEWGVSGAARAGSEGGTRRGGRRRAWHELVAAIEAGSVTALYGYSLSRLARSTRELLDLAALCVAHDVPIRLAKEGDIDGSTPTGRLYLTVLAAMATFEAEVASERGHDRNEAMRQRGQFIGRPGYGWLIDKATGRLVPDPKTMPIVKRVARLYASLRSPARVARALNEAGVAAPQGGIWMEGTVRRILARQPGAKPPATVRGSRAVPAARFSRLLVCPADEYTLTPTRKRYTTAAGEWREWVGYTCPGARYDGAHPKPSAVSESAVLAWAKVEASHLRLPDLVEVHARAEAERAENDARRGRLVDALEAGTITRAEAEPRLARLSAELAALETETEVLAVPGLDWASTPESLNTVLRSLWSTIRFDASMRPASAEWLVPEWRLADPIAMG